MSGLIRLLLATLAAAALSSCAWEPCGGIEEWVVPVGQYRVRAVVSEETGRGAPFPLEDALVVVTEDEVRITYTDEGGQETTVTYAIQP